MPSPLIFHFQAASHTSSAGWIFFLSLFNKNDQSMKWMTDYTQFSSPPALKRRTVKEAILENDPKSYVQLDGRAQCNFDALAMVRGSLLGQRAVGRVKRSHREERDARVMRSPQTEPRPDFPLTEMLFFFFFLPPQTSRNVYPPPPPPPEITMKIYHIAHFP